MTRCSDLFRLVQAQCKPERHRSCRHLTTRAPTSESIWFFKSSRWQGFSSSSCETTQVWQRETWTNIFVRIEIIDWHFAQTVNATTRLIIWVFNYLHNYLICWCHWGGEMTKVGETMEWLLKRRPFLSAWRNKDKPFGLRQTDDLRPQHEAWRPQHRWPPSCIDSVKVGISVFTRNRSPTFARWWVPTSTQLWPHYLIFPLSPVANFHSFSQRMRL